MTHRQLLREVTGDGPGDGPGDASDTLRVHISQLSRKMGADSARLRHLLPEPGMGYRLRGDSP